jgi:hypothetical protein
LQTVFFGGASDRRRTLRDRHPRRGGWLAADNLVGDTHHANGGVCSSANRDKFPPPKKEEFPLRKMDLLGVGAVKLPTQTPEEPSLPTGSPGNAKESVILILTADPSVSIY